MDQNQQLTSEESRPRVESVGKLMAALAKARAEISPPEKKSKGQSGPRTYMYADIASIIEAVTLPLSKHGIAISQIFTTIGGALWFESWLIHESGERWVSRVPVPSIRDPKEFGGWITYFRRYLLTAQLSVAAEDDSDADGLPKDSAPSQSTSSKAKPPAASKPPVTPPAQTPPPAAKNPPKRGISEPQRKRLYAIASATHWTNDEAVAYMSKNFGVESTKEITQAQYEQLCNFMEKNPKPAPVLQEIPEPGSFEPDLPEDGDFNN